MKNADVGLNSFIEKVDCFVFIYWARVCERSPPALPAPAAGHSSRTETTELTNFSQAYERRGTDRRAGIAKSESARSFAPNDSPNEASCDAIESKPKLIPSLLMPEISLSAAKFLRVAKAPSATFFSKGDMVTSSSSEITSNGAPCGETQGIAKPAGGSTASTGCWRGSLCMLVGSFSMRS